MLKNQLPFDLGFELTALAGDYKEDVNRYHIKDMMNGERVARSLRKLGYRIPTRQKHWSGRFEPRTFIDGHCVEIPSPVFCTVKSVLKFYDAAWKTLKRLKYTPQNPQTVCGGNHLHFGIKSLVLMRAVMRDFAHRYYIPWVFTQPDDIDSCDNLNCESVWRSMQNWFCNIFFSTHSPLIPFLYSDKKMRKKDIPSTKFYAIGMNNGGKTLEFRCVEAPKNRDEFLDQIEFFVTYILWVKKEMRKRKIIMPARMTKEQMQAISPDEAAADFYKLLSDMGLDKKRYEKYVKRNLYPRWQLGRERC